MLGLLLQFWVAVKAHEMGWRDLAAVAMGQGDKKYREYKKEPQAVHICRVLEQLCLNMGLSSKEL